MEKKGGEGKMKKKRKKGLKLHSFELIGRDGPDIGYQIGWISGPAAEPDTRYLVGRIHGRISGQTGYPADWISGQISNSTINVSKQHIII